MTSTIKIQFDNGGGMTLEVPGKSWAHHYQDADHAAGDIKAVFSDSCEVGGWDGNEWTEGVRAERHESNDLFVEADSLQDVIDALSQKGDGADCLGYMASAVLLALAPPSVVEIGNGARYVEYRGNVSTDDIDKLASQLDREVSYADQIKIRPGLYRAPLV